MDAMSRRGAGRVLVLGLMAAAAAVLTVPARAAEVPAEIAARLTPAQLKAYQTWRKARGEFEKRHEMYWATIEERRDNRRRKRTAGQPFTAADYVAEQPPKSAGPALAPEIQRIVNDVRPPQPDQQLPTVTDFLAAAKTTFAFVPTPTTEREFKRRFAVEALAAGLSKTQVVRVYALETGGQGTYDMQSGIDPITRSGRPISSALGYAQLLHANSINELVKHGEEFVRRLEQMAAAPGVTPATAKSLRDKAEAVRRMQRVARSVPNEWREHQRLAQTDRGMGIHALNLDADIGPWLQVLKLKGLLVTAAEAGRTSLTGAELELMNLAGPRTGLEMMDPVARPMPTANFFSQGGYYRNGVVRERTAAELLKALDDRMDVHIKKAGAVEFAAVFDEVIAARSGARSPVARVDVPSSTPVGR